MKNNTILEVLGVIFFILLFLIACTRNEILILIWALVTAILSIFILKVLITDKNRIIDIFKNQHIIIRILTIIFVVSAIFELITIQNFNITWTIFLILIIAEFCQWFFKKEE
ncbi:MAG: hypothetical protein UHW99_07330 [Methanobrevibacter sp.]|nr:hypothetical protein [Methanobrevibacter sp.]